MLLLHLSTSFTNQTGPLSLASHNLDRNGINFHRQNSLNRMLGSFGSFIILPLAIGIQQMGFRTCHSSRFLHRPAAQVKMDFLIIKVQGSLGHAQNALLSMEQNVKSQQHFLFYWRHVTFSLTTVCQFSFWLVPLLSHPSRKLLRIKVTPDLHLTYSKNGGNLGLVLKMKNIACISILMTKHVKYTYLNLFKLVLYNTVAFKAN